MEAQSYNSSGGLYKQVKQLAFLLAFILFGSIAGSAQRVININKESSGLRSIKSVLVNQTISSYYGKSLKAREFEYNPELSKLTTNNVGDTIQLDFFEDSQYKAVIKNVTHYDRIGTIGVSAKIVDTNYDYCYIAITKSGAFVNLDLSSTKKTFITSSKDSKSYLCCYNASEFHKKDLPCESIVPPDEIHIQSHATTKAGAFKPYEASAKSTIAAGSETIPGTLSAYGSTDLNASIEIKAIIIYTAGAESWAQSNTGGIDAAITSAMQKATTALSNSNTGVTLTLVNKYKINSTAYDYLDTNASNISNSTALTELELTNDGIMDEIHTYRSNDKADLVTLFRVSGNNDSGGIGYLLTSESGRPDLAFSVCRMEQVASDYAMIHEMGHNLGCSHHKIQNEEGLYSYSYGWRGTNTSGKFATIMTYPQIGTETDYYPRIPYFSDPTITYLNTAVGDATDGNNALTIRHTKLLVSLYSERTGVSLSGITVSSGTLSPSFSSSTTEYTVNVANDVTSFTLNGTTQSVGASVVSTATNAALNVGANTFIIAAKSFDGSYFKTYKVTVIRAVPAKYSYTSRPSFGSDVTAVAGDNALNLQMSTSVLPPVIENSIPVFHTYGNSLIVVKESASSNVAYSPGSLNFLYGTVKFKVSKTGSYTFTSSDTYNIVSIFNSATPSTSSFITSTYYKQVNNYGSEGTATATLNANTDYYLRALSYNKKLADITVSVVGDGTSLIEKDALSGMSYTYIAVSTADSKIKMQSPTADFKTLAAGTYTIYGIPYSSGSTPANFIGHTLAEVGTSDAIIPSSTSMTMTVQAIVDAAVPTISTQPSNATYTTNAVASPLSVAATVTDGGTLSYQWYSNTTNSNSGGTSISGANTSSYTPSTTAVGTIYYYAIVTNTNNSVNGNQTATSKSNVATITVSAIVNAASPNISAQPTGSTYTQGATATALSVSATSSDSGTLSYGIPTRRTATLEERL